MVRVHTNRHIISANRKAGTREPPMTVIRGRKRERGNEIELHGSVRVIYRPDAPLSCGATVWIEADDAVVLS